MASVTTIYPSVSKQPETISNVADNDAATILTKLLTVDGTGSTLDSDTVDGKHATELLSRANHTGAQPISTVTGLQGALDAKQASVTDGTVPDYNGLNVANGTWGGDVVVHRVRDRLFVGDAVLNTGKWSGGYGGDYLTEYGASYFIKNATAAILGVQGRYGLVVGSLSDTATPPNDGLTTSAGALFAVAVNKSESSTNRALYGEGIHKTTTGGATLGLEIVMGNLTSQVPSPTPYDTSTAVATGAQISAERQYGYTVGDDDDPQTVATQPCGMGIEIAGGTNSSTDAAARFIAGLSFRNNSLYGSTGSGLTGTFDAVRMAAGMQVKWYASNTILGAVIRSDVTASASQDVGLIFANNSIKLAGTGEVAIATFVPDTAGTPVNTLTIKNARTGVYPRITGSGSDTNVGFIFEIKGIGPVSFYQGASQEYCRFTPTASTVNFPNFSSSATGNPITIAAAGSDTNIDLYFTPKGSGYLRWGTHAAIAAETVTGYISMRDAGGTIRKLAVVS